MLIGYINLIILKAKVDLGRVKTLWHSKKDNIFELNYMRQSVRVFAKSD